MKRFDALITKQKTATLCKVPFPKKSRKIVKMGIFEKIVFFAVFPDFFKNETSQRAIKQPPWMIFILCHIMGGSVFFQTPGRWRQTVFLVKKKNVGWFVMTKGT